MANVIWMVLALGAMTGMFAICVGVIVALVRLLEGVVARRADKTSLT